jgi:Protein of unknown function (DUF4230)
MSGRESRPARRPPGGGLVVVVLAAIGLFVVGGVVGDLLPSFANPFREETVDRSRPALLKAMTDLREYRAASGHFEVIVDVEKDTRFVPAFIKGERVLFVAVGEVDAAVDFGGLKGDAVEVDGKSVRVTLPPAHFTDPRLDVERSYVYDRDRGIVDRVGSLVGDPGEEREIYTLAQRKLAEGARDNSGLLQRAETNTRRMLTALLISLGFTSVDVRFEDPR